MTIFQKTRYKPNCYWAVVTTIQGTEYVLSSTLSCTRRDAIAKAIEGYDPGVKFGNWRWRYRHGDRVKRVQVNIF